MRRDSRRTSTVKQKMQRNRRQIQFVEILAINLTSRTLRSFFSEITNTWKESAGERIQGRKIQKAAGSFSVVVLFLETAFVKFSVDPTGQKTGRPLVLAFSSSFSRRHPVVVLLPSICGSIRRGRGKKHTATVDKGILGWDKVSANRNYQ